MKVLATCFAALLLAAMLPAHAESTPAQRNQLENCKILSGAVFEFAEARDKKQSKMDTFKEVTHGQSYVPGSLLDETLQWAYAHPEEQPDTASAHFYGRCVLDAYDARNPDTEGELDIAAQGCQQGHSGAPAAIRDCIEDKAQDIVTRVQMAVASAASPAPAAVTTATTLPAPASSTVLAVVQVAPPPTQPAAMPATVPVVPATKPEVPAPAPVVLPQLMATPASPAAAPVAEVAPPIAPIPHEVITAAPAVSVAEPVVASAQAPRPPISAPQAPAAPPPLPPTTAQATPPPVAISVPRPASPAPAPAIAASSAPASVQAAVPQAVASLPPLPGAKVAGPPPNLAGFDKLTLGMSMDDAYKAMGSHGDRDWDSQGEVHTYLISDGHGFIELRSSNTGTLYSIRVVGGADAHVAPILNVVLGDGAFVLLNNVGQPSSRTPLPGDKELWNYLGRNYAFEISPGGDVIGVRIIDTGGADATQ